MEKCPECNFKTVKERTVRDEETGLPVETASVCGNCGHVVRAKKIELN